MHIVSLALGGCVRGEPVQYGITEDTGGHITYILGEMRALAQHPQVSHAEIVTRRFDAPHLGDVHDIEREVLGPGLSITRIDSGNRRYLAKEDLQADRAGFIAAFIAQLRSREVLPDLIHAHFADAADVARAVERELGIPHIYTAHSLGLDKSHAVQGSCPGIDARLAEEDRAIAGAAAIIGSSRDECERQLLGYPSARIDRIHRIIPGTTPQATDDGLIDRARELVKPFLRNNDKPIVLAIARPVHKKNLATLVDAFGANAELRNNANLVILAGQREAADCGEEEQVAVITDLLARIDAHDLYGSVAYPKTHDSAHVAGLYQLAAQSGGVFVNPALIEPYGLTIVEAATYGLPVVATRIGGPLDTVGELGHGVLIDPRDPTAIAAEIEALIDDRDVWQRCSKAGRTRSRALSWTHYADQFVRLAKGLLEPRRDIAARGGPMLRSLFVSDMDNTLTGCPEGVERLRRFLAARPDFAFVIATGRSIVEARRVHREWNLPEPHCWITSVGSEIYWPCADGLLRDDTFPAQASHSEDVSWKPHLVEANVARQVDLELQPIYEQRAFKRSYFYEHEHDIERTREALGQAGLAAQVIASHGRFLDVLPVGAGKAAAMKHVAAQLGIERAQIFAAGDSGNDADMLAACDNAIMVANHAPEIAALSKRSNVYLALSSHGSGAVEGLATLSAKRSTSSTQPVRQPMLEPELRKRIS